MPDRVMAEGSANIWAFRCGVGPRRRAIQLYRFLVGRNGRARHEGWALYDRVPVGRAGHARQGHRKPLAANRRNEYRGLGQTIGFRVRTREPFLTSILCDRTVHPAAGFLGGRPGARGAVLIDGVAPANPKAEQLVPPGALVEVRLPGGGGYGSPSDRDPELIARDVLEAYARSA